MPYGIQAPLSELALVVEQGFKPMRGTLTEGRYVTLEQNGFAVTNPSNAAANHADVSQRWVVHQLDVANNSPTFNFSSAVDGRWLSQQTSLSNSVSGAGVYTVTFVGNDGGYTFQTENRDYLAISSHGEVVIQSQPAPFQLYSVSYTS